MHVQPVWSLFLLLLSVFIAPIIINYLNAHGAGNKAANTSCLPASKKPPRPNKAKARTTFGSSPSYLEKLPEKSSLKGHVPARGQRAGEEWSRRRSTGGTRLPEVLIHCVTGGVQQPREGGIPSVCRHR